MIRFMLLVSAVWSIHLAVSSPYSACAGDGRPNVLFFVTDDQRPDTVAALGNPILQTPNLDALARRGFSFSNAYCMGSTMGAVCNPSRHMFLSGMSLFRYDPKKREGTFGDAMRKAGYETVHISKSRNVAKEYHKAFEHSMYLDDFKERKSGHHGRQAANLAVDFIANKWERERPMFMYVGFAGPHDPRVAAKQWMKRYDRNSISLPANYLPYHPFDNGDLKIRDEKLALWPRTPAIVRRHLHDYYGCITSIDHHIGRIVQAIKDAGEYENTIIVFTSDHGLAMGSHGLFGKQSLYEHSMGVPMIFAGLGIEHGQSDAFMYLFDVFPTVMELTGSAPPKDLDGKSIANVIRGKVEGVRDTVFLAYKNTQRAIRKGDWKLIRYAQVDVTQLFNLRDDPNEQVNLAHHPQHQGKVQELKEELQHQQRQYDDVAPVEVSSPQNGHVDASFFVKE